MHATAHGGCTDTVRQSALKLTLGEKSLAAPGTRTRVSIPCIGMCAALAFSYKLFFLFLSLFNTYAAYTHYKNGGPVTDRGNYWGENEHVTCTDRRHFTYHWRTQTIQANWIQASRHIISNTDDEESGRKISSLTTYLCYNPTIPSTFIPGHGPSRSNRQDQD